MSKSPPEVRTLSTSRLALEPLHVAHAKESFELWHAMTLSGCADNQPPEDVAGLERMYESLNAMKPDDVHDWRVNWLLRERSSQALIGIIKCALFRQDIACVDFFVAGKHRRKGYALEGLSAVLLELRVRHDTRYAQIEVGAHDPALMALAQRLGFIEIGAATGKNVLGGASGKYRILSQRLGDGSRTMEKATRLTFTRLATTAGGRFKSRDH